MFEIDAEAAARVERSATGYHGSLTSAAQQARSVLNAAGLPSTAADLIDEIAGHVHFIGQELGAASRRATAADVFTFSGLLVPANRPSIPATDAAAAEDKKKAEEYAKWLLGEGEHGRNVEDDLKKADEIASFLTEHANDQDVLKAFFDTLGPEGVLKVPATLAALEHSGAPVGHRPFTDDGTSKVGQAQHDLMVAFGNALANASTGGSLDPDFDDDLVKHVADAPARGWALSEVLRNGTYSKDFLVTLGNGLDSIEREANEKGFWYNRATGWGSVDYPRLGLEKDTQYYDPFVGLFEAMGRTPDAGLDFLYPDGVREPGESERAKYYITDRTWSHDKFDALGQMLEGAALEHRTADDPRSKLSALAATDAINLLGARSGDQKIGEAAYDSLGNILSNYIIDVDRAYEMNFTTDSSAQITDFGSRFTNLPPGAAFERQALEDVLSETLTDDGALKKILQAAGVLNSNRTAGAIEHVQAGREGAGALLEDATDRSAHLTGVIIGAAGYGTVQDAKRDDARAEIINDFLRDVANAVPIPGSKFVDFIAGQAINKLQILPSDHEGAATEANWEFHKTAGDTAYVATGTQLAEAGLLKQTDIYGNRYPWYVRVRDDRTGGFKYVFDAELALNDDNYASFYQSLKHDPKWGPTLGDIKGTVNDGVVDGMKGN